MDLSQERRLDPGVAKAKDSRAMPCRSSSDCVAAPGQALCRTQRQTSPAIGDKRHPIHLRRIGDSRVSGEDRAVGEGDLNARIRSQRGNHGSRAAIGADRDGEAETRVT